MSEQETLEAVDVLVSKTAEDELTRVVEAEDVEPDAVIEVLLTEYADHLLFNDSLNKAVHRSSYDVAD
jgi:hypothetical protein